MSNTNTADQFTGNPLFQGGENPFAGTAATSDPGLMLQNPGFNVCYLEGSNMACASTGLLPGLIATASAFLAIVMIGYFLGSFLARRRAYRKFMRGDGDREHMLTWSRHETSITLSYLLIIVGSFLFVIGASGAIELEVPGAKIATSFPGIVVIYLGYRMWTLANAAITAD